MQMGSSEYLERIAEPEIDVASGSCDELMY